MSSPSEKDSSLSPDKKGKGPSLGQLLKQKNLLAVADKAKGVVQRQRGIEEDIEESDEILSFKPEGKEDKEKFVKDLIKNSISRKVKQVPIRLIDLSSESLKLITQWDLKEKLEKKLDEFYEELLNDLALWPKITKEKIVRCAEEKIDPHLRYAILSHRWDGVEPNFQRANKEFSSWWSTPVEDDPGICKLIQFCRKAQSKGIHLTWSDTCCIDKLSARDPIDPAAPPIDPAELPESLNSMFQWYRRADLCIVYMAETTSWSDVEKKKDGKWEDRWFTRGWTLQELLAPKALKFYTQEWEELIQGSGNDKDIDQSEDGRDTELGKVIRKVLQKISETTGIEMAQIQDFRPEKDVISMRQRMIWASERETTKDEDIAYCLMGIFDVGMEVRYGEGSDEAFYRLQEQIIKRHRDDSLFNWYGEPSARSTVMASHPRCFSHKHDETEKLEPYRFSEQSFLTRLFCACTGITCMNACMTQICSCAVRVDVVIRAGEIINQAESHFDVTNNGLRIKVDTTRVLYMYSLPHKKGNHRRYLYLAGHERVKVMFTLAMKKEIDGESKGRQEFVVIPLGTEGDTSQGERLPRIALLLYKVDNNVWKRVRTVEPIVLKRTKVKLVNEDLLRTIYIR